MNISSYLSHHDQISGPVACMSCQNVKWLEAAYGEVP